jgi:uncharacterized protein (DUF433 family)
MFSRAPFDPRRKAEISSNPRIMGGVPCIAGTRVPVETILAYINAGETEFTIYTDFPAIPLGSIELVINWAKTNGRSILLPVRRMFNANTA